MLMLLLVHAHHLLAPAPHGLIDAASNTAAHPVELAGVLKTIRRAVVAILAITFVAGGFVGFLLARVIYRRR